MKITPLLRRPGVLAMLVLGAAVFLAGCTPVVLPESWPGLSADGALGPDGRYTDARYVYVAYRNTIFRVDTQTAPQGRATERLIDWAARAPNNGQMFAAPALGADGHVYIGTYSHMVHAFSPDAAPDPTVPLASFNVPASNDRIIADALVVDGEVVIGQGDKGVRVLDAQTGAQKAAFEETKFGVWAAPALDAEQNVLYVPSMDHHVYALDGDTLDLLWKVDVGGVVASTPLLHEGMLYVGTFSNELVAIDVAGQAIAREFPTDGWVWATPRLSGGNLYFGDMKGNVYSINAETFDQNWKVRNEQNPGAVRGRVAVVDGKVIAAFESKYLQAFDEQSGVTLWTSSPASEDRILGDVIVIDNMAITTTLSVNQLVVAYDIGTGGRLWSAREPNQDDFNRLTTPGAQTPAQP